MSRRCLLDQLRRIDIDASNPCEEEESRIEACVPAVELLDSILDGLVDEGVPDCLGADAFPQSLKSARLSLLGFTEAVGSCLQAPLEHQGEIMKVYLVSSVEVMPYYLQNLGLFVEADAVIIELNSVFSNSFVSLLEHTPFLHEFAAKPDLCQTTKLQSRRSQERGGFELTCSTRLMPLRWQVVCQPDP